MTIRLASEVAEDDPVARRSRSRRRPTPSQPASGMRPPRRGPLRRRRAAAARPATSPRRIELATDMLDELRHRRIRADAVRVLSVAGLLAHDDEALRRAVEAPTGNCASPRARHRGRRRAGTGSRCCDGQPSIVRPERRRPPTGRWPSTAGRCGSIGREAIDAGSADAAVDRVRAWARPDPHGQAVLAAVEAAATGDEDRWHDALAIAVDHSLRLIAVDALEGLAAAAAAPRAGPNACGSSPPAQRLRDETGYHGVSASNSKRSTPPARRHRSSRRRR